MNVDVILLCEYARIFDGSRLMIVGTMNGITVPGVPVKLPAIHIAIVVEAHRELKGTSHVCEVRILNARREIVGSPMKYDFAFHPETPPPGMYCRNTQVIAVSVAFQEEGPHSFELHIDGTYHAATNLYVAVAKG